MNETLNRVSQIELNRIYNDINNDYKAGMIGTEYYVTRYDSKDNELVFIFNRKFRKWVLNHDIELIEDEKD